jgi:hypothetical protein
MSSTALGRRCSSAAYLSDAGHLSGWLYSYLIIIRYIIIKSGLFLTISKDIKIFKHLYTTITRNKNETWRWLIWRDSVVLLTAQGKEIEITWKDSKEANNKFWPNNYPFALEEKKLVLLYNQPSYGPNVLLSA